MVHFHFVQLAWLAIIDNLLLILTLQSILLVVFFLFIATFNYLRWSQIAIQFIHFIIHIQSLEIIVFPNLSNRKLKKIISIELRRKMYKYQVFAVCIVFIGECLWCASTCWYIHFVFCFTSIRRNMFGRTANILKFAFFYFFVSIFFAVVIHQAECGVGRNNQQQMSRQMDQYDQNGYNAGPYNNFNYIANQKNSNGANKIMSRSSDSGLSAWGLITIIMLIIGIGMAGYYGIICYPLICKEERNYDIMDAASTTASANTPTRSSDFEKSGNYSSRSTTPSVIINS